MAEIVTSPGPNYRCGTALPKWSILHSISKGNEGIYSGDGLPPGSTRVLALLRDDSMMPTLTVGTILIEERPLITELLGLKNEPCSGNWSVVKTLDGFALDQKIHAAGWTFFFMAAEVKVMFFGALGSKKIQTALQRILAKVRHQDFNSLEITGIVAKRFLGVPYATVTAHSRHIQQSCYLDDTEQRHAFQRGAEGARA
jgi:hypothetical protein